MKEIEKSINDGWTIVPPEHTKKALRWIEAAEVSLEPADSSGDRQQGDDETDNELSRL